MEKVKGSPRGKVKAFGLEKARAMESGKQAGVLRRVRASGKDLRENAMDAGR